MPLARRIAGLFCAAALAAARATGAEAGSLGTVRFDAYTPLSSNAELARRLLSPLDAAKLPQLLAQSRSVLREQPVDLAQESFVLYVPSRKPPNGYGLLVFIPPWYFARLPDGWADVLDDKGIIYVSAANSGNDQSVLGRREPLVILAEQNVARRYPLDPARIYVGGFSGGSRVAMRVALGYPDIFRGAFLNAGSDPIGQRDSPLPPRDLLEMFQARTHVVFATGERDEFIRQGDLASMHAMEDWCVFGIEHQLIPSAVHEVASGEALSRALDWLDAAPPPAAADLASCRTRVAGEREAALQSVAALIAAGRRDDARSRLDDVNTTFGGLAAPDIVALARQLGPS